MNSDFAAEKEELSVLITINHLVGYGGSEKYVLELISGLTELNIRVYLHALQKGDSFAVALTKGANPWKNERVDCVLINHNTNLQIARFFARKVPVLMLCHGIYPYIEQPITGLSWYFGVSEEVTSRLQRIGLPASILRNPVMFDNAEAKTKENDLLILCQGYEAINYLKDAIPSEKSAVFANKHDIESPHITQLMERSHVVIGSGRAIIEGIASHCATLLFDSRHYDELTYIGPITLENWRNASYSNYSGRGMQKVTVQNLRDDLVNTLNSLPSYQTTLARELRAFHHTNYIVSDLIQKINELLVLPRGKNNVFKQFKVRDLRTNLEIERWAIPAR